MPAAKPATSTTTAAANRLAGSAMKKNEVDLDSPYRLSAHGTGDRNALVELDKKWEATKKDLVGTQNTLEETKEALKQAEAERSEEQREFEAKFAGLDNAAYARARTDLLREMEADRTAARESQENARLHEKSSAETAKALEKARAEFKAFQGRETRERAKLLERAKAKAEGKVKQEAQEIMQKKEAERDTMFAEELRMLRDAGISRRDERGSYDEYRELWYELNRTTGTLEMHLKSLQRLSKEKVDFWRNTGDNFKPESIEAWFPQRYPKLTDKLRSLYTNKLEAAERSYATLESRTQELYQLEVGARSSAHYSRIMTRYHHFEVDHTATQTISVCREMLNEAPLAVRREQLDKELREIERQITLYTPGKRREQLDYNRAALVRSRSIIAALLAFYKNARQAEMFKQLHQSPREVQEIFMRSWPAEDFIAQADRTWAAYRREQGVEEDVENREERDKFDDIRSKVHAERSNFERSISMRQLLEASLDEPVEGADRDSHAEKLAQMQVKAESSARAFLREVTDSKRATSATIASRPTATPSRPIAPSRVAVPARQSKQEVGETEQHFQRQGRELKAKIASATSPAEKEELEARFKEHRDQYMQWQLQRRDARKTQTTGETQKGTASEGVSDGEQTTTRQAERGANASETSGTGAKTIVSKTKTLSPRALRKRLRAQLHRDKIKAAPGSQASAGTDSVSFPAFKPTESKQAPRVYWPDCPSPLSISISAMPSIRAMSTTSTHIEGADTTSFDPAAETAEALEQWQICSSRSSWSSYEPSQPSEAGSVHSEPFDDGVMEAASHDLSHLTYHMSKEDHRNAVMASPNTASAYWTHKLYKNGEGRSPPVYYCTNLEQAEARAEEFLDDSVIGFDIEWEIGHSPGKSGIKKNVSLIQIASDDKIALFHIAVFKGSTIEELMPVSMRQILESRDVVKAGVNIQGDASRMRACLNVEMAGIFELSHLYKVVTFSDTPDLINRRPFKLADQVQDVLLLPLKKDAVRTSAWSKRLDMQQTEYAASDAYAGFRLYHALEAKRKVMDPMPPRPAFWEEHKPLQLGDGTLIQARTRKNALTGGKKIAEPEDGDEEEEFFDAVETLDAYDLGAQTSKIAGVPLSGLSVMYPTLPTLDDDLGASLSGLTISAPVEDKSPPEKTVARKAGPPQSPEIDQAEQWVTQWRASRPNEYTVKATQAQLRAYALWHEQGLKCKDVAVLLRETPLALQTVATYVLEAVRHENLEFEGENARDALGILPSSVHRRYGKIVEECGK